MSHRTYPPLLRRLQPAPRQQQQPFDEAGGPLPTKFYDVVSPAHRQVVRQVLETEQQTGTVPSDGRHIDLWLNKWMPTEDILWQLLEQLTRAKHQLTRTRWKTHDALLRQAFANTMDLAITEAQCAEMTSLVGPATASSSSRHRRRAMSSSSSASTSRPLLPVRRPRQQVAEDNRIVFENWRRYMQKTESLVRSVRDEFARVLAQRTMDMLTSFTSHTEVGQSAAQDIQQRLTAVEKAVKTKCMVDGEDSQSEEEDDDEKPLTAAAAAAAPTTRYQHPQHPRRRSRGMVVQEEESSAAFVSSSRQQQSGSSSNSSNSRVEPDMSDRTVHLSLHFDQ